ncbi:MAG: four helix bundle protein [Planctomycetota bacterium]|nr:four helix bundle protein [Planctomycetota bacterium]
MNPEQFKARTKAFALRVISMVEALPSNRTALRLGDQVLRSGTSVGANYRAACRARSKADFIAKMKIVEEECDETLYWIELLVESKHVNAKRVESLYLEGREILAMVVASLKTSRSVNRQS